MEKEQPTKMSAFVKDGTALNILNEGIQSAWDEGYAKGFENATKLSEERDAHMVTDRIAFVEKVSSLESELESVLRHTRKTYYAAKQALANSIPHEDDGKYDPDEREG